ncbi:glycoside hydrolase family 17 protein [Ophiostoma piceae UAMH 11346]|uniref:Probable beta-glucosidase btgE n=1 Tax=Ophiostoma piceae (strain UAMH 11346) TaxID=1262450 RepID=S3C796_OPHP1|nr:glycoside hydrolase family 17 protein [Ophiostoma piceae UAMH 11346]
MKGSIVAAAAVFVAGASASRLHHRHADAHKLFEKRAAADELCTTIINTITGDYFWVPTPQCTDSTVTLTTTSTATTSSKVHYNTTAPAPTTIPATTSTSIVVPTTTIVDTTVVVESCSVPTPVVSTCKVPGTYTFPATTVVVTETTTVCGASTTKVPAGTHTLGGVTTVVATETTVVCPFATTSTQSNGVVTSIIQETTYVCPSAGTYTIAPITTVCATETVVVVPVVTSYVPGTYTRPAVVTTVTETDIVIVCPFSIPTTTTVVPVVTPTPAPVEVTTTAVAVPATTKTEAKTSATPKATSTPNKLGGGDQWAITYTPYSNGGGCKAASDVLSDLKEIQSKGFNTIRVYSTDCDTLPNVGAACEEIGLKMIIGVFIGEVGCDNADPDVASQISAIKAWAKWDLVELVVVGNEAGFQKFCTPSELSGLITEVKEIIKTDGYTVPVTTTDTVDTWENTDFSSALCAVVDVVACNAHAYFNAETAPADAGKFVAGQLEIVKNICGKDGYVLETGWPSSCVANGVATCSEDDQATAISSLKSELGGSVVFFSYSNDDWKDNGSCECEQHWGCGQLFA